jgi:chaperonin GroES
MKATPLFRRILVQVLTKEDTTPGGIIIPDAAKEKPTEALVVAVGSGCTEVKVGDRVLFSKYAGNEIVVNEVPHLVLQEEDVQVRLEDE